MLFVIARFQKGNGIWEWVAAFAEAAMVGALADWFAVVALFRHPLGIPIPHTAIIKNKKTAVAENLAVFIRDKFLATDTLIAKLRGYNPAEHLAVYLISKDNSNVLAKAATRLLGDSLDFIDDERVQKLIRSALKNRIEDFDLSTSAASIIDSLKNDNRHQIVLNDLLNRFATWLGSPEAQTRLANAINDMCAKEYPLLVAFIPNRDQFARGAGEKIVKRVTAFIEEINSNPSHEIRGNFDTAVTNFSTRLKSDSELREKVEGIKSAVLHNQVITDYAQNIGNAVKNWLTYDLNQPKSKTEEKIAAAIIAIGSALSLNKDLQNSLNEHLETLIVKYGDGMRISIAGHISETVQKWDCDEYVNEIEFSIGSDLQFIRMNGTLVGGIIGLILHLISLLF